MNTVTLQKERIHSGNLLLINARHRLSSPAPTDLLPIDTRMPHVVLRHDAATILRHILDELSAGNDIIPVSGYRPAAEQRAIYEGSLAENGEVFTKAYVALPHHSEHQTGLAIDLGLNKEDIDFIRPDFPYEGICGAFRKMAPAYGFIERYASGKEQVTGIAHEPWHFRYVGYPHSEIMTEKALALEEYIAFIKRYPYDGEHLCIRKNGKHFTIFYAAVNEAGSTTIALPENAFYQVSGNNVDGFIVTVWRNDGSLD